MVDTANLALPLLAAAQSQKHVTHNEALLRLDALIQIAVLAMSQNTPPATPNAGDRYVIGTAPSADFSGQAGRIGTSSDSYNTLSAKLNSALFAARAASEGGSGDIRVTLNKQASSNTASQLYQTGWSGRAETGLSGDDNWHLKVSADGATWREALVANAATGAVRMDVILSGRASQGNAGRFESDFDGTSATAIVLTDISAVASATAINFRKNGGVVGSIKLAASGTSFLTTSDYRLKQNILPLKDGLERVLLLKPSRFAFNAQPDQFVDGFIAHEVAAFIPEAVSGEKDAVDDDGNIIPQSVDLGKLVPVLVAAVQALAERVAVLESR